MQKRLAIFLGLLFVGLSHQTLAERIDWSKGEWEIDRSRSKLEIRSADENFSLGLSGYMQLNTMFSFDPAGSKRDLDIELNKARISLFGNAFHRSLTYFIQLGFENDPERSQAKKNKSSGYLKDYYLNVEPHRHVQLRIGKFGLPFSRQSMVVGSHTQFYKNSSASDGFLLGDDGKDVGIMVHNGRNERYEWAVSAVSNGLVGRFGYNYRGIDGYEMTDFYGGPLRFAVGVNGYAKLDETKDYLSPEFNVFALGADFLLKVRNFSTNGALYYSFSKVTGSKGKNGLGAGLDLGYLLNDRYEPVVRYAWNGANSRNSHEVLVGLNYYIYGQHLKLQAYAGSKVAGSKVSSLLGGVQFQFAL